MLLVVSAAVHFNLVHTSETAAWVGSDQTLLIAGVLTLTDFFADKVPWIDHGLHLIHTVLAPASGGIAAMAVSSADPHVAALAGAAGAVNALGVHGVRSVTRVGSSVASLGVLTPVVSVLEDMLALVATVIAFVAPFFSAIIAVCATIVVLIIGRKVARYIRNRKQKAASNRLLQGSK